MYKLPKYKIITVGNVYETALDDLYEEQKTKCAELGIDTSFEGKKVKIHIFDTPFGDECITEMNIYDAIEGLAIKDGVDLVQYENGNYGFVSYYNMKKDAFEILNN